MSEIIVKLTGDHIKLKGGEYVQDIVRCNECRKVREDGGHANCNGYLYCRKWKTLVDEDGYCSYGEREGE